MEDAYNKAYIEIMDYLGKNFDVTMADAALHSEQLTEIVKKEVEEEISNGTE